MVELHHLVEDPWEPFQRFQSVCALHRVAWQLHLEIDVCFNFRDEPEPCSFCPTAGTASQGAGVANLNTDVQVNFRPTTQQGLSSMSSRQSMGPGRQIADKSFFLSLLREKLQDVTNETTKLQRDTEKVRALITCAQSHH